LATVLNTNRKIMNEIPPWNYLAAEGDHSSMFDVGRSMFNVQFLNFLLPRHIQNVQ